MKYSKLLKIGLLAVLMSGLVFTSCGSKDDDDEPTPNPTPVNPGGNTDDPNVKPDDPNNKPDDPVNPDDPNNKPDPKPTYTLTLDANGGENAPEAVTFEDKTSIPADGNIARTGYKFLGWSEKQDATAADLKAGDEISAKTVTLYAVWQKLLTLTFDANGGTDAPALEYFDGKIVLSDQATATRKGYIFLGWSTSKDAKDAELKAGDEITGDDVTIYAVWDITVYILKYHCDYKNENYVDEQHFTIKDVESGKQSLSTWCSNLPEGYALIGWKMKNSDVVYRIGETADILFSADLYPVIGKTTSTEEREYQSYEGN